MLEGVLWNVRLEQMPSVGAFCALDDNHGGAPHDHGDLGHAGPRWQPLVSIGAADNTDDSGQDVRNRSQKEAYGHDIGQPNRDRRDCDGRRYNVCNRAIDDRVSPKGFAERDITFP